MEEFELSILKNDSGKTVELIFSCTLDRFLVFCHLFVI
jgi:hypothetical protein